MLNKLVLTTAIGDYTGEITINSADEKAGKNRMHLDLRGSSDVDALRAFLEARGATRLWEASQGPHRWVTWADPEGNEFCA